MASPSRSRAKDTPPATGLRLSTRLALNSHARRDGNHSDSSSDGFSTSDSEQMIEGLRGGSQKLTLRPLNASTADEGTDAINTRFHGKSSLVTLVEVTRRYKELHISETAGGDTELSMPGAVPDESYFKRPDFWLPQPVDPPLDSRNCF